jgi:predicted transcriptional regulator
MQTLHNKLKEIRIQSENIQTIVDHYNMGLITMSEKHNQLLDVLLSIDNTKKDICKEY